MPLSHAPYDILASHYGSVGNYHFRHYLMKLQIEKGRMHVVANIDEKHK